MLSRLVIFAALVWLVARVLKAGLHTLAGGKVATPNQPSGRAHPAAQQAQALTPLPVVACAQCGLHIPQTEAIVRHGQPYCCSSHAESA